MIVEKKLVLNQQALRNLNPAGKNPEFIPLTTSCILTCLCTPPGGGAVAH